MVWRRSPAVRYWEQRPRDLFLSLTAGDYPDLPWQPNIWVSPNCLSSVTTASLNNSVKSSSGVEWINRVACFFTEILFSNIKTLLYATIRVNLKDSMLSCIFHIRAFCCIYILPQWKNSHKKDIKIISRSMAGQEWSSLIRTVIPVQKFSFLSNSRIQAATFSFFHSLLKLPETWFIHLKGQIIALQELFCKNPRVLFHRLWSEFVNSPCWNCTMTGGRSLCDHRGAVLERLKWLS